MCAGAYACAHKSTKQNSKQKSTKQKQEANIQNKNPTKPKIPKAKNTTSEKYNKPPGPQLSPATWPPATPQPPSPQLKIQEAKNT